MSERVEVDATPVSIPDTVPVIQQDTQTDVVDPAYYRGVPGLLKLLETAFSLVAYITMSSSSFVCNVSTYHYFRFVTMSAFISTMIRWFVLLFKIRLWMPLEMVFYSIVVFLYFFADLFISIHACKTEEMVSAVFGWLAIVPFCIDGFRVARRYQQTRTETEPPQTIILCCF